MSDFGTQTGGVGTLTEEVRRWLGGGAEDDLTALIVALQLSDDRGPGLVRARRALREALSGLDVTAAEPLAGR